MSEKSKAEPASNVVNSLRALRMAKGLSQGQLADGALVTRQAVCAIEADQYLPTTRLRCGSRMYWAATLKIFLASKQREN